MLEERNTFTEISDVIARHLTLASTNEGLRQRQQDAAQETEQIRFHTRLCYSRRTVSALLELPPTEAKPFSTAVNMLQNFLSILFQALCRLETQMQAKQKTEEILAASATISRLKKEIEANQQETAILEARQQMGHAKTTQQMLEQGQVGKEVSSFTA